MIFEFTLDALISVFAWIYSFLPVATLPQGVLDAISALSSGASLVNRVIPIEQIIVAGGVILTLEVSIMVYKIANDTFNKVRGSGG